MRQFICTLLLYRVAYGLVFSKLSTLGQTELVRGDYISSCLGFYRMSLLPDACQLQVLDLPDRSKPSIHPTSTNRCFLPTPSVSAVINLFLRAQRWSLIPMSSFFSSPNPTPPTVRPYSWLISWGISISLALSLLSTSLLKGGYILLRWLKVAWSSMLTRTSNARPT